MKDEKIGQYHVHLRIHADVIDSVLATSPEAAARQVENNLDQDTDVFEYLSNAEVEVYDVEYEERGI